MDSDDMRELWQSQGGEDAPIDLEGLRKKTGKFRSTIWWRNFREYFFICLMVPYFSYFAWTARLLLMRVGYGLLVAGLLYVAYELHRRASASRPPGELGWDNCMAFHRAQLERQRDALIGIWRWYLGPLVPGLAMVWIGISIPAFRRSGAKGLISLLVLAGVPGIIGWQVARLNKDAAAKIQRQIDELETTAGPNTPA